VRIRAARLRPLLVLVLIASAGVLGSCGSSSADATRTDASAAAAISKEQRTFDRAATGHAIPIILKRVDHAIAQASATRNRAGLWASAFSQAMAAAQSGDGYDSAGNGGATASGRAMIHAALPLWDRYARLHPRVVDDGAFRALLTAFSDSGLRNPGGLRGRLIVIAPALTDDLRLTVTRLFPSLASVVSSPSAPDQFLKPAPIIRFHDDDGFRFSLRLVGSKKLIRYPDQAVDTAPGKVLIALRVEVTNETPGRRTYLPIDATSLELGVRDTRCHVSPWKGLCSNYALVTYGDSAGAIAGEMSGGQEELAPGVPFAFWAVSEELRDRPARDITVDIHSYVRLTFTTRPATPGEPEGDVRRLNLDGPALRPCGDQC
jgi:hypothetical protein